MNSIAYRTLTMIGHDYHIIETSQEIKIMFTELKEMPQS